MCGPRVDKWAPLHGCSRESSCVCVCVCVRVGDCPAHAAECMQGQVGGQAGLGRVGLSACRGR